LLTSILVSLNSLWGFGSSEAPLEEDLPREVKSEDAILVSHHQLTLMHLSAQKRLELSAEGRQGIDLESESGH
jgi:hypothetical protein